MDLRRLCEPRDETVAARASSALFLVGAFLLTVYVLVEPVPMPGFAHPLSWAMLVVLLACSALPVLVPLPAMTRGGVWLLLPVAGVVTIGVLAHVFPDQLDVAHLLLGLPVLFAASQVRATAAALVTALAIGFDVSALLAAQPPAEALVDGLFVAAVLVLTTVLLVLVMERIDRLVAELRRQAAVDGLTGLVTRRVLDEALTSALSAAVAREGSALVLVDVDSFKSVNDSHGHPVGDDALVHIAGILRGHVRAADAVISRLGGDELAVLLPGCSAAVAAARAQELVDAVAAAPLRLADGTLLALSISVGVAHAPSHATELRTLYAAADAALYAAKRGGRGRARVAAG
ncbi:GGDEF domain-containing protein [Geodermatophilus maliterrae]|uniref:GGDEF domain-containing protein n=1 Tax=Geodermatophilus maliterrae TaxID=3162531 RepID=A0ABV3XJU9_9ACTN